MSIRYTRTRYSVNPEWRKRVENNPNLTDGAKELLIKDAKQTARDKNIGEFISSIISSIIVFVIYAVIVGLIVLITNLFNN